jgi:predicted 3-demethylubiquinone-9 3-methyltransferase (glyoxalase superfamily)
MQKIIPSLWYDGNAEDAVKFYMTVFKTAKITNVARWTGAGPGPKGSVLTMSFKMNGQEFLAINGGPQYKFTPAVSFVVYCDTQKEVDYYWSRLSKGGKEVQCGWLEDKFGMSWQIVPTALGGMIGGKDVERAGRVMRAMMKMVKLDIKTLTDAYKG